MRPGCGRSPILVIGTELVDGFLHVAQVPVDPGSARRGLGRAQLDHAAGLAATAGLPAVTLATFAEVSWNARST